MLVVQHRPVECARAQFQTASEPICGR